MCKHVHILFKAEDVVHSWVVSCFPTAFGAKSKLPKPWRISLLFSSFPKHRATSLPQGPLKALGLDLRMPGPLSNHSSLSTNLPPTNRFS